VSEFRVTVAGCPFVVTPSERLTPAEREALQRLGSEEAEGPPFVLHLRDTHLEARDAPGDGEPAAITSDGERVLVVHQRFAGVIDPFGYTADVHRGESTEAFAIELVLRTALGCRLPLEGGLLVHTAGVILDGGAYLFHGISGAGKSTLAGFMRDILSDELVAVQHGRARATGFWGTLDALDAPSGDYPLRATIELARGEGVSLEPLTTRETTRGLLRVAVVPPQPRLWSAALRVIEELATVPAFRLAWTPSGENALRVVAALSP
jgi:hypothetical protein